MNYLDSTLLSKFKLMLTLYVGDLIIDSKNALVSLFKVWCSIGLIFILAFLFVAYLIGALFSVNFADKIKQFLDKLRYA